MKTKDRTTRTINEDNYLEVIALFALAFCLTCMEMAIAHFHLFLG